MGEETTPSAMPTMDSPRPNVSKAEVPGNPTIAANSKTGSCTMQPLVASTRKPWNTSVSSGGKSHAVDMPITTIPNSVEISLPSIRLLPLLQQQCGPCRFGLYPGHDFVNHFGSFIRIS